MFKKHDEQQLIIEKQKQLDAELKQAEFEKSNKERWMVNFERESRTNTANVLHREYLKKQQAERDQIEYGKSEEARMRRAQLEAEENMARWKTMYTDEEIELKKLDPNSNVATEYIEYTNLRDEGKVKDIFDYKRYKRKEERAYEKRKRKLRG